MVALFLVSLLWWCSRAIPRVRLLGLPAWGCFEGSVGFALTHHLLAISIEGVVDNPFGGVLLMVVLETEVTEAFSNRLQPLALRLVPERVISISPIDDLAEQDQGQITG